MIRIAPGQRLIARTVAALGGGALDAVIGYSDQSLADYAGGTHLVHITGTDPVEFCPAPTGAGVIARDLDLASITNPTDQNVTVEIRFEVVSTGAQYLAVSLAIPAGGHVEHTGRGWARYSAAGSLMLDGAGGGTLPTNLALQVRADGITITSSTGNGADLPLADDANAGLQSPQQHAQLAGLTAALEGKADTGHGHEVGDVGGLQVALNGKADAVHQHAIADVVGLPQALDGKEAAGAAAAAVQQLQSALRSAAYADAGAFATYVQGARADTALQPAAIGQTVQAFDATLQALAAVVTLADKLIYATGADEFGVTDFPAAARAFLSAANQVAQRAALGLDSAAVLAADADVLLAANSDTRLATQKAVKAYVDALLAAQDVLQFKGAIDCSGSPNYPAAECGHFYKVGVAGRIGGAGGPKVEAGDSLYCTQDGTAAGDHAAVGARWSIVQVNIDGAVVGPAASVDLRIAVFDGATGKLLRDGGVTVGELVASTTAAAATKDTPADADSLPLVDSQAANVLKRWTVAALKAALKTVNDALYAARGLITGAGLTMNTGKLAGRGSAGQGAVEEIALGTGLGMTGNTLNVTLSAGATTGANTFSDAQTIQKAAGAATSADGVVLENTTAAAAGSQANSLRTRWRGYGWKTNAAAASQAVDFIAEVQPTQGASAPAGKLVISSAINGGAFGARLAIGSDNALTDGQSDGFYMRRANGDYAIFAGYTGAILGGSYNTARVPFVASAYYMMAALARNAPLCWSGSDNDASPGNGDIGLARDAAGVLAVTNGVVSGSITASPRDLKLRNVLSSGNLSTGVVSKSADYTATTSDHTILVDASLGPRVITGYPCAANVGKRLTIKKVDATSNSVTFDPNAAETVDGAATRVAATQWSGFTLQVDEAGASWRVVSVF